MIRKRLRATILWALLIAVAFIGIQTLVANLYIHIASQQPSGVQAEELIRDGDLLAVVTVVSGLVGALLTLLAAAFTVGKTHLRDHLGLRSPTPIQTLKWCFAFLALLMVLEALTRFMQRPTVPDVMLEVYDSADSKLLLFVAVVGVASLFEELFFRGFLLEGLRQTVLGAAGSVLLTALLWSVVHVQYDVLDMGSIFLIGVFLGTARLRTGSTPLAMILHGLNNGLAFFVLAS